MAKQDFYEILGVSKSANADELKRAYRKLAMQYHPDRNAGDKGAEQKFKDLNEAYDVLKDDQKRGAYDRFGHAAFEQGGGRGPGDFGFAETDPSREKQSGLGRCSCLSRGGIRTTRKVEGCQPGAPKSCPKGAGTCCEVGLMKIVI